MISGSLEDVAVADLVQFIGLGRRTGILLLRRGPSRIDVGFHRGNIIGVRRAGEPGLDRFLLERGAVTAEALAAALALQQDRRPRGSLAEALVASGAITVERLHQTIIAQLKTTVLELLGWETGTFEFARDELLPAEGLVSCPGHMVPQFSLDTGGLLLELTHAIDEGRDAPAEDLAWERLPGFEDVPALAVPLAEAGLALEAAPLVLDDPGADLLADVPTLVPGPALTAAAEGAQGEAGEEHLPSDARPRLQVVSEDPLLLDLLRSRLQAENGSLRSVSLWGAGSSLPGEPAPLVLVDLRGSVTPSAIEKIKRSRPRASVVALLDQVGQLAEAYKAGAVAALPRDPDAVASCIESLRHDQGFGTYREELEREVRAGFSKLRRVMADLRSGLLSATMALNLMDIVSESAERAILFLARGDGLAPLGAFGFGAGGRPLTDLCRKPRLTYDGNALALAAEDGRSRSLAFREAGLPPHMTDLLGEPRSGQIVCLPVVGTDRVIAVIYADNGHLPWPVEDLELLELATAQVGIAFENELIRRNILR